MSLSLRGTFFLYCLELLTIAALSRNRSLFPRKAHTGKGSLCYLSVLLGSFNKWLLGACSLPGTLLCTRDCKFNPPVLWESHSEERFS
jgi:hypothetical protein